MSFVILQAVVPLNAGFIVTPTRDIAFMCNTSVLNCFWLVTHN